MKTAMMGWKRLMARTTKIKSRPVAYSSAVALVVLFF